MARKKKVLNEKQKFDKQVKDSLERQKKTFANERATLERANKPANTASSPQNFRERFRASRDARLAAEGRTTGKPAPSTPSGSAPKGTPSKPTNVSGSGGGGKTTTGVPDTKTDKPKGRKIKKGGAAVGVFGAIDAFTNKTESQDQDFNFQEFAGLAPRVVGADPDVLSRSLESLPFVPELNINENLRSGAAAFQNFFSGDDKRGLEINDFSFGAPQSLEDATLARQAGIEKATARLAGPNASERSLRLARTQVRDDAARLTELISNEQFDFNQLTEADKNLALDFGVKPPSAIPAETNLREAAVAEVGDGVDQAALLERFEFLKANFNSGAANKFAAENNLNVDNVLPSAEQQALLDKRNAIPDATSSSNANGALLPNGTRSISGLPTPQGINETARSEGRPDGAGGIELPGVGTPELERGPTPIFKKVGADGTVEFNQEGGLGFEKVDLGTGSAVPNLKGGFVASASQDNIGQFPGTSSFTESIGKELRSRRTDFRRQQRHARSNQKGLLTRARASIERANPHLRNLLKRGNKNEQGAASAALNRNTIAAANILQQGRDAFKAEDFDTTGPVLEADRKDISAAAVDANLARTETFAERNRLDAATAVIGANQDEREFLRDLSGDARQDTIQFLDESFPDDAEGNPNPSRSQFFNTFNELRPLNFPQLNKQAQNQVRRRSAFVADFRQEIIDAELSVDPNLFTQPFEQMAQQVLTNNVPGITVTGNRSFVDTITNLGEAARSEFSRNELRTNFIKITGGRTLTLGEFMGFGQGQGFSESSVVDLTRQATQ